METLSGYVFDGVKSLEEACNKGKDRNKLRIQRLGSLMDPHTRSSVTDSEIEQVLHNGHALDRSIADILVDQSSGSIVAKVKRTRDLVRHFDPIEGKTPAASADIILAVVEAQLRLYSESPASLDDLARRVDRVKKSKYYLGLFGAFNSLFATIQKEMAKKNPALSLIQYCTDRGPPAHVGTNTVLWVNPPFIPGVASSLLRDARKLVQDAKSAGILFIISERCANEMQGNQLESFLSFPLRKSHTNGMSCLLMSMSPPDLLPAELVGQLKFVPREGRRRPSSQSDRGRDRRANSRDRSKDRSGSRGKGAKGKGKSN